MGSKTVATILAVGLFLSVAVQIDTAFQVSHLHDVVATLSEGHQLSITIDEGLHEKGQYTIEALQETREEVDRLGNLLMTDVIKLDNATLAMDENMALVLQVLSKQEDQDTQLAQAVLQLSKHQEALHQKVVELVEAERARQEARKNFRAEIPTPGGSYNG